MLRSFVAGFSNPQRERGSPLFGRVAKRRQRIALGVSPRLAFI